VAAQRAECVAQRQLTAIMQAPRRAKSWLAFLVVAGTEVAYCCGPGPADRERMDGLPNVPGNFRVGRLWIGRCPRKTCLTSDRESEIPRCRPYEMFRRRVSLYSCTLWWASS
jgi:hypothetical protein